MRLCNTLFLFSNVWAKSLLFGIIWLVFCELFCCGCDNIDELDDNGEDAESINMAVEVADWGSDPNQVSLELLKNPLSGSDNWPPVEAGDGLNVAIWLK